MLEFEKVGSDSIIGLYQHREFVILSRSNYWYVSSVINPDKSHADHQPKIFRQIADKLEELSGK